MIEYDFDELDNDFITIWSNYILYQDKGRIIGHLTMLAEKGQINAIQSWYLLKEASEQNETIEKIVDNYKMDNFNQMHAVANRMFDKDRENILALRRKITDEIISLRVDSSLSIDYIKYKRHPYSKKVEETAKFAEEILNSSGSALICERLFELYYAEPYILDNKKICQKDFITLRKIFNKKLAKNPQDIPVKFSLGKNLVFFGTDNEIKKGQKILSELAERPLSCCYSKQKESNIER